MTIKGLAFIAAALCISCGTVDLAKRYPNMVADADPYQVGSVSVSFDRLFSFQLRESDVDVIFYPRENMVALEFRHELTLYRQFWNEPARRRFTEALSRYEDDLANQRLTGRYNRSRAAYGKFNGRAEWETFSFSATYFSLPVIELGYRFRGNTPYFTVLQNSARAGSEMQSRSNFESLQFSIYFSPAQAEDLAQIFDRDFLLATLQNR